MKARAIKYGTEDEVVYGGAYRTPEAAYIASWVRVTPDDIEVTHQEVKPKTTQYQIADEWLSEEEIVRRCVDPLELQIRLNGIREENQRLRDEVERLKNEIHELIHG